MDLFKASLASCHNSILAACQKKSQGWIFQDPFGKGLELFLLDLPLTFACPGKEFMPEISTIRKDLKDALLRLDSAKVSLLFKEIKSSTGGLLSMEQVMVPVLEEIGLAWEKGGVSLSQVYMAGKICESVVDQHLLKQGEAKKDGPRLAIAVLADHHALGKRMVKSALHSAGYKMLDYGHGCQSRDLCEYVVRDKVDILMISCLMLASALKVEDLVTRLQDAGSNASVVVGGAPFRLEPSLYKKLGAKAMGRNSAEAVGIVQSWKAESA